MTQHPALRMTPMNKPGTEDPDDPPIHVPQAPGMSNGMTHYWCPGDMQDCGLNPTRQTIATLCECCTLYAERYPEWQTM